MITITPTATELIRAYNLQNATFLDATDPNKFTGRIPALNYEKDLPVGKSSLGNPVMSNLKFLAGSYHDRLSDGKEYLIEFDEFSLDLVLLHVTQIKKVITTDAAGMDGTAKEYVGMGDYEIQIDGIINGPNGQYPRNEVNTLYQMLKAPIAIGVVSRYLQMLNINQIVVKDFSFNQEAGWYSQQRFSILAVSDEPMEICDVRFNTVSGGPLKLTFNTP